MGYMGYSRQQVAGFRGAAAKIKITTAEYIRCRENGAKHWCKYHKEWLPIENFHKGNRINTCRRCYAEQQKIKKPKTKEKLKL